MRRERARSVILGTGLALIVGALLTVWIWQERVQADRTCTAPDCVKRHRIIPEYSPTQGVLVADALLTNHRDMLFIPALLRTGVKVWTLSTLPDLFQGYQTLLRDQLQLPSSQLLRLHRLEIEARSAWVRDWAPIFSETDQQGGMGMLDPSYLGHAHEVEDRVPEALAQSQEWSAQPVTREILPVHLEGGNLLCHEALCFVTGTGQAETAAQLKQPNNGAAAKALRQQLVQPVSALPDLPHEPTGHLDLWAKFANAKTLWIAQIEGPTLQLAPPEARSEVTAMQSFLDAQADPQSPGSLAALATQAIPGLQIVRVPTPLPWKHQGRWVFPSYLNSLLVNSFAIVPRFRQALPREQPPHAYADTALLSGYEQQIETVYGQAGYRVLWVEADHVIRDGGAWHCAALQIPQGRSHQSLQSH
ncbi:MAG: agmatine deiminase family protein [Candidatus Sericytochromatia bacterium]